MREWLARLRDWFRRDRLDGELAEELRFHRQHLERDAGAEAPRRFGNVTRIREESRDRWSIAWLDTFQQDLRWALRGLRRSPGFTATVVLTLGLGIGGNAAMFGVIDRLMFRPFPYLRDPAGVHRVYLQTSREQTVTRATFPYTRYLDLKGATGAFSMYAGVAEQRLALGAGEQVRERLVAGVSASLFDFFAARPVLGRFFGAAEDETPRGTAVAVLGFGLWKSEFGGRNVIGQVLRVGNVPCTIIGVAPDGFVGVSEGEPPAVFVPITLLPLAAGENKADNYFSIYNWDWMGVVVRRKPGVSATAATDDLSRGFVLSRNAQRRLDPGLPADSVAHPRAIAGALKAAAGPDAGLESRTLLWITGVAAIVLLVACANVMNLMFARVLGRRREIALRLALGVSRRRLAGQFVTESLLIAALGCVAGLAIGQGIGMAVRRLFLPAAASLDVITDWRTLAVAATLALGAGLLTGIVPLLTMRDDLAGTLRTTARQMSPLGAGARSLLLVVQGALSVVLLVGASLFVQSLGHVRAMRLGYDPEKVLMVLPSYGAVRMDSSSSVAFRRRLLEAAQAIPGVAYAARVDSRPFAMNSTALLVPGVDSVQRLGRFIFQLTTPDYFKVMGTRIVRGRPLGHEDRAGAPLVAVVSQSMGRAAWPGRDPVGQCFRVSFGATAARAQPCTTVIGIAEDAVQQSLADAQRFMYYLPLDQVDPSWGNHILVRVATHTAGASSELVRRELNKVMPGDGYVTVDPLMDLLDSHRRSWQLGATMFVAFGGLALVVAAVGLYGVIGYNVAQRMHELGVRIALGARTGDVVKLVAGQGVAFALAGVAVGLGLALVAARWIQPLLFEQSAKDPVIYGFVAGLLLLVALVASAAPAWRATKADPNSALRSD